MSDREIGMSPEIDEARGKELNDEDDPIHWEHGQLVREVRRLVGERAVIERAARTVLSNGTQLVKGVTLAEAPLGDQFDTRWRKCLDLLEKALDTPASAPEEPQHQGIVGAICAFGCGATKDELRTNGHRRGCHGALIETRAVLQRTYALLRSWLDGEKPIEDTRNALNDPSLSR